MPTKRPAVFFDRDGTLIHEVNYCSKPSQVHAIHGMADALVKLENAGFAIVIITNQSGIGRGFFTQKDFELTQNEVMRQLRPATITATYYDASTPDHPSDRRKPSPRMIEEAAHDHGLDLQHSFFVGDRATDIECGKRANLRTVLVETGYGRNSLDCGADAIVADAPAAVDWILQEVACRS